MNQFPTPGHLASWAGVCPGSNESAGRIKSTKTRPGNRYLKGALGVAALNQARTTKTYFSAKYRHLAPTRGPMKAIVAVEHAMLIAAWHMLTNGEFYRDPGADYYTRHDPTKTKSPRRQTTRSPRIPGHHRTRPAGRLEPQAPRNHGGIGAAVALSHVTHQRGHQPWSPKFSRQFFRRASRRRGTGKYGARLHGLAGDARRSSSCRDCLC